MQHAPDKMKLHELHQRRLEATVSLVEDGLERMEHLLTEGGQDRIVRAVEGTISADERASLRESVHKLREALHLLAERFSLERRPLDIRQVLNAELSSAWVMLENCRAKRMKGYGVEFEPQARTALEESVEQLLAQVIALRGKLRSS
jgi:hypothetical protein